MLKVGKPNAGYSPISVADMDPMVQVKNLRKEFPSKGGGVAVAVDEGLMTPVLRHADRKGLAELAVETRALAGRARERKLQPDEMAGSTFTTSNLGMFGIEEFTAIVNPPNACILAIGAIRDVPVVKDGEIVPGNRMKVTLSCDHRVVDGATGAQFLQTLRHYLEEPLNLLM